MTLKILRVERITGVNKQLYWLRSRNIDKNTKLSKKIGKFIRYSIKNYLIYGKSMQSEPKKRSLRRGSAVGSEKDIEFPLSAQKIRSKADVKPIKTAVGVLF